MNIDKMLKKALGKDNSRDMTLYHGTDLQNYEQIKTVGLKPYRSMWSHRPALFLTANKNAARRYASRKAGTTGWPVILKVDVPDDLFHPNEVSRSRGNQYTQLVTHYAIPPQNIHIDDSKNAGMTVPFRRTLYNKYKGRWFRPKDVIEDYRKHLYAGHVKIPGEETASDRRQDAVTYGSADLQSQLRRMSESGFLLRQPYGKQHEYMVNPAITKAEIKQKYKPYNAGKREQKIQDIRAEARSRATTAFTGTSRTFEDDTEPYDFLAFEGQGMMSTGLANRIGMSPNVRKVDNPFGFGKLVYVRRTPKGGGMSSISDMYAYDFKKAFEPTEVEITTVERDGKVEPRLKIKRIAGMDEAEAVVGQIKEVLAEQQASKIPLEKQEEIKDIYRPTSYQETLYIKEDIERQKQKAEQEENIRSGIKYVFDSDSKNKSKVSKIVDVATPLPAYTSKEINVQFQKYFGKPKSPAVEYKEGDFDPELMEAEEKIEFTKEEIDDIIDEMEKAAKGLTPEEIENQIKREKEAYKQSTPQERVGQFLPNLEMAKQMTPEQREKMARVSAFQQARINAHKQAKMDELYNVRRGMKGFVKKRISETDNTSNIPYSDDGKNSIRPNVLIRQRINKLPVYVYRGPGRVVEYNRQINPYFMTFTPRPDIHNVEEAEATSRKEHVTLSTLKNEGGFFAEEIKPEVNPYFLHISDPRLEGIEKQKFYEAVKRYPNLVGEIEKRENQANVILAGGVAIEGDTENKRIYRPNIAGSSYPGSPTSKRAAVAFVSTTKTRRNPAGVLFHELKHTDQPITDDNKSVVLVTAGSKEYNEQPKEEEAQRFAINKQMDVEYNVQAPKRKEVEETTVQEKLGRIDEKEYHKQLGEVLLSDDEVKQVKRERAAEGMKYIFDDSKDSKKSWHTKIVPQKKQDYIMSNYMNKAVSNVNVNGNKISMNYDGKRIVNKFKAVPYRWDIASWAHMKDDDTLYVSKQIKPERVPGVLVHEAVEQYVSEKKGLSYNRAHEVALVAEEDYVKHKLKQHWGGYQNSVLNTKGDK